MKSSKKHYLCGFNGFKQIEECTISKPNSESPAKQVKVDVLAGDSQKSSEIHEEPQYFSIPKQVETSIKMFTWSNVWGFTGDDKLTCYGFNSSQLLTKLRDVRKDLQIETVTSNGNSVILQNNSNISLIENHGRICKVRSSIDSGALVSGTRDHVYGIKEGQCFEGTFGTTLEDGDCILLNLHPISLNIEVKTVSCGFEHTLMLTRQGAVYSSGSGSRGQLGHGEVTVDLQKVPRCVDTFTGIFVVTIAAGGWHSTVVTDSGDVYVWGWNESGQLGLPNGTISTSKHIDGASHHDIGERSSGEASGTELEKHTDHVNTERIVKDHVATFTEAESLTVLGGKRNMKEPEEENIGGMPTFFNDPNLVKNTSQNNIKKSEFYEEHQTMKKNHNIIDSSGSLENEIKSTDCVTGIDTAESDCVSQKYYQSIDCVQVQTVPYGLDFPDELHVKYASCGTRHTCLVSDSGILLTCGWNNYGQLCQGDTECRDYFETVTFFTKKKEKVTDVNAQYWNTYVVTEEKH